MFLSLGGAVTLAGISGKFGTLKNQAASLELLGYMYTRGTVREEFWAEYARNKVVETAPVGKAEKSAPAAKGKGKEAQEAPAVVYPSIPDSSHPDPNHGPNRSFWASLLSQCGDDNYSYLSNAPPVSVCLLGLLHESAGTLVSAGVDANTVDSLGVSPLMYSLLFGLRDITVALLQSGANTDAIDQAGNPAVKYALLSLCDTSKIPDKHCFNPEDKVLNLYGSGIILDVILQSNVDLRVCDVEGNYPFHIAASFGAISMSIGGYFISVRNQSYISSTSCSPSTTFDQLLRAGAQVSSCTKNGLIPLHICSQYSDIESMKFLIAAGSTINTIDSFGFLPLHYCFAGGHERAVEAVSVLLNSGIGRPINYAMFDDRRTGKSNDEKIAIDLDSSLENIYSEVLIPSSIQLQRAAEIDLLTLKTFEGINLMQLVLSAHTLAYDNLVLFNVSNDFNYRPRLMKFLFEKIPVDFFDFYCNTDNLGTTLLHAMSLFFVGETPIQQVCPKRRVNPVLYGNLEIQLVDCIFETVGLDLNITCSRVVLKDSSQEVFPENWYPVMGAIFSKNVTLCQSFISNGADINLFDATSFVSKHVVSDSFSVGIKGLLAMRDQQPQIQTDD